jgi:N-acetylmuramoyl-L-alanine amidase
MMNMRKARDTMKRRAAAGTVIGVALLLILAPFITAGRVTAASQAYADILAQAAAAHRTWAHDSVGVTSPSTIWYLAEGATAGDFETWLLVQNPGEEPAEIDVRLQTAEGERQGPQGTIPPLTRRSYNLGDYVTTFDVSATVTATSGVICERAMYGGGRTWAHDSVGVTSPSTIWYLAEGATAGDFETWLLVQNPGEEPAEIDVRLQTAEGERQGPQGTIPPLTRRSYNLGDYVTTFDVSATVTATSGVICERAMYGGGRTWAHDSVGVTSPSTIWYLAEGATAGDFETWLLVQNPGEEPAEIDVRLQTAEGERQGPQGTIPPLTRRSYNLGDYVTTFDVSATVTATSGVICERAMYGGGRTWAHDSVGVTSPSTIWYLAEGATAGDFETWLLVQNPGEEPAEIDVRLQTAEGERQGPQGTIPPLTRRSYNLGDYVTTFDVSATVTATSGVICERAMYGLTVVCLDPGHASTPYEIDPETGLNTQDWVNEPEMTIVYDIALRTRAILEARGIRVVMTKNYLQEPVSLKRRAEIANDAHARMIVHIHADPGIAAPTTFYPGPAPYNWKANSQTGRTAYIDPAVQAQSETAAKRFHAAMAAYVRQALGAGDGGTVVENRGATGTGNYGPIFSYDIWSKVPTFTLENNLAFADAHRQEIAESIAAGIMSAL